MTREHKWQLRYEAAERAMETMLRECDIQRRRANQLEELLRQQNADTESVEALCKQLEEYDDAIGALLSVHNAYVEQTLMSVQIQFPDVAARWLAGIRPFIGLHAAVDVGLTRALDTFETADKLKFPEVPIGPVCVSQPRHSF